MGLFRSRISAEEALDRLVEATTPNPLPKGESPRIDPFTPEDLEHERTYCGLFAAIFGIKFCHQSDWRTNGADLFTALNERVLPRLAKERGRPAELEGAQLTDSIETYNLALTLGASDRTGTVFFQEVGKSFAANLGHPQSVELASIGSKTFREALERIRTLTATFKISRVGA